MEELSQLKLILKNSFAGIKTDMDEIKSKQSESLSASLRLREDVEMMKDDYVPKDKVNALKIKVGEINDTLKKLWDLDSSIKAVDEKKTDKKEFETRFEKLKDEIQKKLSEMNAASNRRIVEYTNSITKNIEDVNNNSAKVFSKISEQMKVFATKNQLKDLVQNFTQEFIAVKADVAEIKKIKDTITASELEKRTALINSRVDLLAKEILKTNQNVSQQVTSEQVKSVVDSINREFDVLKAEISELIKLKKYMGLVESEALSKKDFEKQLANIHSEIDAEKKEIRELREHSRLYARYSDIERNMKGMESVLTRKILDLEKEVISLKIFERRYDTELVKESKKIEKIERLYEKPVAAETRMEPKYLREGRPLNFLPFLSVVSIILIILAFVGLAGAIISYFALEPVWTNYLTIGAVVAFVVGIVLRVIVVKKRK
jgi:hypothetical protein